MRILLSLTALTFVGIAAVSCGNLDEGVNAHNLTGTVVIPNAALGTTGEIGMIFVGVYSGVDTRYGYPGPVTAPAQSSAGADAFPFGGTTIGTYTNRDLRYVCQRVVRADAPRQVGSNWELDFEVLQFPFHEGAVVWAFADQRSAVSPAFTTCNPNDGYSDYPQVLVDLLTATAAAQEGHFDVTIDEPVGLSLFSATLDPCEPFDPEDPTPVWCTATLLLDEGGNYWEVAAMNDTSLNVTIRRPLGGIAEPVLDSGSQARIFQYTNDPDFVSERYGSQHVDVLNFPQNYVESGDVVSDGAAVLNDLSHITVTVDQVIP